MTNPFTSADVQNMREAQTVHAYTDTAYYIPAPDNSTLDEYGQPTPSTTKTYFECAFVDTAERENWREMDVEEVEAEIYFSALSPTKGGTITPVTRFGQSVAEKRFEITGIQGRGAFGFVCALKSVAI